MRSPSDCTGVSCLRPQVERGYIALRDQGVCTKLRPPSVQLGCEGDSRCAGSATSHVKTCRTSPFEAPLCVIEWASTQYRGGTHMFLDLQVVARDFSLRARMSAA